MDKKICGPFLTWDEWLATNPLLAHMRLAKMPQTELASKVGVSVNSVYRWLRVTSAPEAEKIEKIAQVLSLDKDAFEILWQSWMDARP